MLNKNTYRFMDIKNKAKNNFSVTWIYFMLSLYITYTIIKLHDCIYICIRYRTLKYTFTLISHLFFMHFQSLTSNDKTIKIYSSLFHTLDTSYRRAGYIIEILIFFLHLHRTCIRTCIFSIEYLWVFPTNPDESRGIFRNINKPLRIHAPRLMYISHCSSPRPPRASSRVFPFHSQCPPLPLFSLSLLLSIGLSWLQSAVISAGVIFVALTRPALPRRHCTGCSLRIV